MADLIFNASVLKSEKDCPIVTMFLEQNDQTLSVNPAFEMTRMMHPNGKCCRVIPPKEVVNSTLSGIILKVFKKDNVDTKVKGFTVYLTNQEESNDFHLDYLKIDGQPLTASEDNLGYWNYKLKINEIVRLENNKDYLCKLYPTYQDYNLCLSKHYLKQNLKILNCTPPWMTSRKDLWCPSLMNLDQEVYKRLKSFLSDIAEGKADPGPCLTSCRSER